MEQLKAFSFPSSGLQAESLRAAAAPPFLPILVGLGSAILPHFAEPERQSSLPFTSATIALFSLCAQGQLAVSGTRTHRNLSSYTVLS